MSAETESRERFVRETAQHEMTVLHDDGLYRHLRFQRADGWSFYWFDLITWPGRLVVCGDVGDFMFSRTEDMFEFFESRGRGVIDNVEWGINPHYWGEKLRGATSGRESVRVFSVERFRASVLDWFEDQAKDLSSDADRAALREAVDEQLIGPYVDHNSYEEGARILLADFEHAGLTIDASEWSMREYSWSYLWCCWAIVWGIGKYRAAVPVGGAEAPKS